MILGFISGVLFALLAFVVYAVGQILKYNFCGPKKTKLEEL